MAPTAVHPHEKTTSPHLDGRLQALRDVLYSARQGDFSVRLPTEGPADGVMGQVAISFNALIEQNEALVNELRRMDRSVGFEGKTTERASLAASGSWKLAVDAVNSLVEKMA